MRSTVFINALREKDKGATGLRQLAGIRSGDCGTLAVVLDPKVFAEVPGSPFTYQVSEEVRSAFVRFPTFDAAGRQVRKGLTTGDDFRFVRLWWEVLPSRTVTGPLGASPDIFRRQTLGGKPWVPFAKGGAYSSYYADQHLVINWGNDGATMGSSAGFIMRNPGCYFRPGITFANRPDKRGSFSVLPQCAIFSGSGSGIFSASPWYDLAWLNSLPAFILILATQARGTEGGQTLKYEVGDINRLPYPEATGAERSDVAGLARRSFELRRFRSSQGEWSHVFVSAMKGAREKDSLDLGHLAALRMSSRDEADHEIQRDARTIDDYFTTQVGLGAGDVAGSVGEQAESGDCLESSTDAADDEQSQSDDLRSMTVSLLSCALGCAFGRWDIRYATGEKTSPELPDPFAPLPVCSPGMLQGEDGLPLSATPTGYPLHINWTGILVDEPNHADDILKRVREVLHLLWPATSDSIEAEMCAALDVKDLRDYFHKPGSGGFWMDHVHMYSKSHRKAPIYWLLQSSHKNYGVWLYYQRLDSDLLFKVLQNYVEPKLKLEQNHETEASHKLTAGGLSVSETRQAQKDLEKQQDLVAEIRDFRDTLKKAADLRLTPDLDDGVVLNIAPLHDLVPWAEASKYWDELQVGKYPWSAIAKQLETTR